MELNNEERLTRQQQKALHLFFTQLACELNREGKTMTMILNRFVIEAPVTKNSIKELVWKPLQEAMYSKKSTTELLKKEEIDGIYDALNKFFAEELQVIVPPFPSLDKQNLKKTYNAMIYK